MHAWAQKIIVRQKSLQICYLFNTNLLYQDFGRRLTETTWAALSQTVIDSAVREWRQRLRTCVRAGGGHSENMLK